MTRIGLAVAPRLTLLNSVLIQPSTNPTDIYQMGRGAMECLLAEGLQCVNGLSEELACSLLDVLAKPESILSKICTHARAYKSAYLFACVHVFSSALRGIL